MNWLLPAIFCVSMNAHAQKFYPTSFDVPAVLSYDQLMYLPDAKRIEYIKDLRLALAAVEASMLKGAKSRGHAELEMWKEEMQALLMKIGEAALPSANAGPLQTDPAPAVTAQNSQLATSQGCPPGNYVMDPNTRICSRERSIMHKACNTNEVAVTIGGKEYCQATAVYKAPALNLPAQTTGASVIPLDAKPNRPIQFGGPPPDKIKLPSQGDLSNDQTKPRPGPTVENQEKMDKQRGYKIVETPNTCKKREDASNYHTDAQGAYKARASASAGAPPSKYRNCIVGGMFSEYNSNEIKAGNCKKVQEFPPGEHAAGSEKLKCSGNKAMCNPMLYCGPEKNKAHCFPVTQNLTKECETKAKSKAECDPFKGNTMVAGAKENWQEFAADMNKLCGGDAAGKRFNEYFCEECKLLQERMKSIALKYKAYTDTMPKSAPTGTLAAPTPGDGKSAR